jgi:DNA-binding transcriptional regulator WhiA
LKINGNLLVRDNRLGLSIRTENKKIAKLLFLEIKKILRRGSDYCVGKETLKTTGRQHSYFFRDSSKGPDDFGGT